jgi:uncharacterized protein (TIGR02145 family)
MKKLLRVSSGLLIIVLIFSCTKKEIVRSPIVETTSVSGVLYTTAIAEGVLSDDGADQVVYKGVCWARHSVPTIKDSLTINGTGLGEFSSSILGLTPGKKYYLRAFAFNSVDTTYGKEISFSTHLTGVKFNPLLTYGTITDIEGKSYKTIPIGSKVWMAENLRTTKLNDGTEIGLITNDADWSNLTNPAYCWFNNDQAFYENIYGAYYNWFTVNTGKLCPSGWHVPSDTEWQTFVDNLGGSSIAGSKIKEVGTNNWIYSNKSATNESGFTALPAGMRGALDGVFGGQGYYGGWWSTTELLPSPLSSAWCRWIHGDTTVLARSEIYKKDGFSVRCIMD